jgi:hypothetical protein
VLRGDFPAQYPGQHTAAAPAKSMTTIRILHLQHIETNSAERRLEICGEQGLDTRQFYKEEKGTLGDRLSSSSAQTLMKLLPQEASMPIFPSFRDAFRHTHVLGRSVDEGFPPASSPPLAFESMNLNP